MKPFEYASYLLMKIRGRCSTATLSFSVSYSHPRCRQRWTAECIRKFLTSSKFIDSKIYFNFYPSSYFGSYRSGFHVLRIARQFMARQLKELDEADPPAAPRPRPTRRRSTACPHRSASGGIGSGFGAQRRTGGRACGGVGGRVRRRVDSCCLRRFDRLGRFIGFLCCTERFVEYQAAVLEGRLPVGICRFRRHQHSRCDIA